MDILEILALLAVAGLFFLLVRRMFRRTSATRAAEPPPLPRRTLPNMAYKHPERGVFYRSGNAAAVKPRIPRETEDSGGGDFPSGMLTGMVLAQALDSPAEAADHDKADTGFAVTDHSAYAGHDATPPDGDASHGSCSSHSSCGSCGGGSCGGGSCGGD